jgi:two-component system, chemotaxis family, sensor kinase CheA
MATNRSSVEDCLNRIAAQLPLLEKTDLTRLTAVMTGLDDMLKASTLPGAFSSQVKRTVALIENMIMENTPFEAGSKMLGESIGKMIKAAAKIGPRAAEEGTPEQRRGETGTENKKPAETDENNDGNDTGDMTIADDLKDLVLKFANNQQAVLEDFEAFILEFEKGAPQAKAAIKRILHTWKGEFGVLDMREYAKLIHDIEDLLEKDHASGEQLFRLKDFLAECMNSFAEGKLPCIGSAERLSFFGSEETKGKDPRPIEPQKKPSETRSAPLVDGLAPQSPTPQLVKTTVDRPFTGDASLLSDFINESRDHTHSAETSLLELETDPTVAEKIDGVFRAWHTIKGVAAFMHLKEIQALAHGMESIMDKARKHEMQLQAHCIDMLLEGNDCLKHFLELVEEAMASGTLRIPENYDSLMRRLSGPMEACAEADVVVPEKKIGEILLKRGALPPEKIRDALAKQQAGDQRKIGEILIEEQQVPAQAIGSALAAQTAARSGTIEETIRVPINRIGQLVDTIGEAVIAHSMIFGHDSIRNAKDVGLHTKVEHAAMIMRSIQEMAMSLRMVSIKSTFQKMARLVRDLAGKIGREVDFVTEGEDTELDKSVVEKIGDPLIHMIRNSMDHGIEPAAQRIAAGKPAKGTLKLRAFHRAGSIFIEVSDDGKGLDKEAIVKKAISRNLCEEGQALTDQEIYKFIFLPGFSTAKQVTDVSGRGVGMDVVRRNIEALRGSVEIQTAMGKGTTFSIRLPLTLAIVDGMIVRSESETYIIPTLAIVESLKPEKDQITSVMNRASMLKVRGEFFPLIHLQSLFSGGSKASSADGGVVMIVEDMLGKKVGIHVDEIVGQQQVVIKGLGEGMHDVPGVTGGAIMNDGTVSLILDIGGIIKMAVG